jgi:hypothetical protein
MPVIALKILASINSAVSDPVVLALTEKRDAPHAWPAGLEFPAAD